ncbi:hypothetical protein D299_gp137 [Escherichia phage HX01]|nr:hypothetical protein D299_gp137 [Escherichia phage HX01]
MGLRSHLEYNKFINKQKTITRLKEIK